MKWTKEEIEILQKYYTDCDCVEMRRLLPNRSLKSLRSKAARLGVKKSEQLTYEINRRNGSYVRSILESNDDYKRKCEESRRNTIRKERMRIAYGLPQKTKLRLCNESKKVRAKVYNVRLRLKKRGYEIETNSFDAYYNERTRRSPCENVYKNLGFTFIRSGESAYREQVKAHNNVQPFTDFYL